MHKPCGSLSEAKIQKYLSKQINSLKNQAILKHQKHRKYRAVSPLHNKKSTLNLTTPKITLVGSGYVGMSLSVLLAQHNEVTVLDIDPARVETINNNQSTVADAEIEAFLAEHAGAVITSHGQLGRQSGYMGVPVQKTLSSPPANVN